MVEYFESLCIRNLNAPKLDTSFNLPKPQIWKTTITNKQGKYKFSAVKTTNHSINMHTPESADTGFDSFAR